MIIYNIRLTFKKEVSKTQRLDGTNGMIVYDNLWITMKKKGITQYTLIKKYKISPTQITRLKRNESVSTHTIDVFCKILDCDVCDIMSFKKDDLENMFKDQKVKIVDDAYSGLKEMLFLRKEKDLVYVAGSLYLVGEIKEQLLEIEKKQ